MRASRCWKQESWPSAVLEVNGVLVVDKPEGMTSHDVVNAVRRISGTRSVGHAGTLDPMATGVLVVAVGKATKFIRFLRTDPKEYLAKVAFGIETDTEDITGRVIGEHDPSALRLEPLEEALNQFKGKIEQVPPMVSAIKLKGEALYKIARRGEQVEREPRPVEIYALELVDFSSGETAEATLRVKCSAGTYIRSLARDIGRALRVGGALSALRRLRSGDFDESSAVPLEELARREEVESKLIPLAEALVGLPAVRIRREAERAVLNGVQVVPADVMRAGKANIGEEVRIISSVGDLLAIGKMGDDGIVKPVRVIAKDHEEDLRA